VLLAGELLRQCQTFVEDGVHPQVIIRSFRQATAMSLTKIKEVRAASAKLL
jgi:T-complex protein 1 subunit eta